MKKIILIFAVLMLVSGSLVSANDCDILKPVLEQFYSASKNENLKNYTDVMDMDYIKENMLDNYEDYVKSAWKVYDISNYEIKIYNCKIENDDAILYFNLKSSLLGEGKTIENQRNFIWIFHKLDDWKIRYVMDEEIFDKYQDAKLGNLFVGATEEVLDKAIKDATETAQFIEQGTWSMINKYNSMGESSKKNSSDIASTVSSNTKKEKWTNTSGRTTWITNTKSYNTRKFVDFVLLSILIFILYKFIKQQDIKWLKDLDNKGKFLYIVGKFWKYLKEYIGIVWKYSKKIVIVMVQLLKATYTKIKPIIIKSIKKISDKIQNSKKN